jgi:hypothetical protein
MLDFLHIMFKIWINALNDKIIFQYIREFRKIWFLYLSGFGQPFA